MLKTATTAPKPKNGNNFLFLGGITFGEGAEDTTTAGGGGTETGAGGSTTGGETGVTGATTEGGETTGIDTVDGGGGVAVISGGIGADGLIGRSSIISSLPKKIINARTI